MIYLFLTFTFIAGILIRWCCIQLPNIMYAKWSDECLAYLQSLPEKSQKDISYPITHTTLFIKKTWWHYLPFSSLFWKEKQHAAKTRLSYIALDLALFSSSLLILYHFDSYLYWGSSLLFTWLLITSSFIDFEHQILPDEISYLLLWAGLIVSCGNLYTYSTSAIFGAFIAYAFLFLLSSLFKILRKKDGIGQGDLKLFAAIGAWTGTMQLPLILFLASLFSLFFIIIRKIVTREKCSTPASFGPFLALAGWLILLWGNDISLYLPL